VWDKPTQIKELFLQSSLWPLLMELAGQLNIKVRVEKLEHVPGGLCRLKGENLIFIDQGLNQDARTRRLALSIKELDLEQVYIKPLLRDYLEQLEK
jgi:hypothetical protein